MRALAILAMAALLSACGAQPKVSVRAAEHQGRPDPIVAMILSSDGQPLTAVRANGPITGVVSDQRGGWYLNGAFRRLDGRAVPGLAHVLADGRMDGMWQPPAALRAWYGQRQTVVFPFGMAASASTLYLVRLLGDTDSFDLAVLDARTGGQLAPVRKLAGNAPALAADEEHLFIGNPLPITSCVSEYDRLGQRLLVRFAMHMLAEAGCVNSLIPAGRVVYVAGSMGVHATLPGAAVARFDTATGRLDPSWRPELASCRNCYGLAYSIVLGDGIVFENPGTGGPVEALDARTGVPVKSWRPPRIVTSGPLGMALAGNRLFVIADARNLLALDASSGRRLPCWRPPAHVTPGPIVASGSEVLVVLRR